MDRQGISFLETELDNPGPDPQALIIDGKWCSEVQSGQLLATVKVIEAAAKQAGILFGSPIEIGSSETRSIATIPAYSLSGSKLYVDGVELIRRRHRLVELRMGVDTSWMRGVPPVNVFIAWLQSKGWWQADHVTTSLAVGNCETVITPLDFQEIASSYLEFRLLLLGCANIVGEIPGFVKEFKELFETLNHHLTVKGSTLIHARTRKLGDVMIVIDKSRLYVYRIADTCIPVVYSDFVWDIIECIRDGYDENGLLIAKQWRLQSELLG